ncbi:hypothetical protein [Agrobacterium vitis]|uniref:hypothetical protein n=1 Tax=Agrobacterium vitis TaxID=373 RepID=UPI000871C874|nr:hypothetical protein [Agrobacterium vitis]MCE6073837.1 hypothetical protein [Agrobacterium vitis]MCM2452831.1 hypothetical protein [Agrobacterium vitis]MCM2468667.1 hypothetical protein [Agrobacterium vitis]MUO71618.1 hypothetical protein [Agrobacterium vitis]MUO85727.1 hypothetical protein [Agrobacterium vitis]
MSDDSKRLEEEYKFLVNRWDDYDRRALTIKGWVSAGALIGVINIKPDTSHYIIITGLAIVISAWFNEAIWKSWQHANQHRIHLLERYFRGEDTPDLKPFQVHKSWGESTPDPRTLCAIFPEMMRLSAIFPYVVIIAALMYILLRPA